MRREAEQDTRPEIPDEAESVEILERPPTPSPDYVPQLGQLPTRKTHPLSIHVLALLIPSSTLGVLARLGLQALGTYEGRSIFPLAYPQAVGCLIMGFSLGSKDSFSHFYPPLYTAITTGFCGSITTFSGWELDVFNAWINAKQFHRSGLRDFVDGTGLSVFTLSLSLASLSFGLNLASITAPYLRPLSPPTQIIRLILTIVSIASYGAVFPAYFLLPADFRHQVTAALLFAFPGTLTRYILSIYLNTLIKAMPLGTLTANMTGTALLGAFTVLKNKGHTSVSPGACSILQGLSDGYCGCLTTVSTFAAEVHGFRRWKAFRYALVSWSLGQILLLIILGPSFWSGPAKEQQTCSFG